MHACSAPNPSPHPLSLSSPYLTPILVLIIPCSFSFNKKHITTIYTSSKPIPQPLPPPVVHLSAFSYSRQYVPPKAPLYLLMDHTQRSPPTNYITRRSDNMTSKARPNHTISKSTTRLLRFL